MSYLAPFRQILDGVPDVGGVVSDEFECENGGLSFISYARPGSYIDDYVTTLSED